jgi:hypothetical protein
VIRSQHFGLALTAFRLRWVPLWRDDAPFNA